MKQDKHISREFLSNVVEITSKISAWFGFEINSWSCYHEEEPGVHDLAYNLIAMGSDSYGDDLIIDFENKTMCLVQSYYTNAFGFDHAALKHLGSKDKSALRGLAKSHGFEFDSYEKARD